MTRLCRALYIWTWTHPHTHMQRNTHTQSSSKGHLCSINVAAMKVLSLRVHLAFIQIHISWHWNKQLLSLIMIMMCVCVVVCVWVTTPWQVNDLTFLPSLLSLLPLSRRTHLNYNDWMNFKKMEISTVGRKPLIYVMFNLKSELGKKLITTQ